MSKYLIILPPYKHEEHVISVSENYITGILVPVIFGDEWLKSSVQISRRNEQGKWQSIDLQKQKERLCRLMIKEHIPLKCGDIGYVFEEKYYYFSHDADLIQGLKWFKKYVDKTIAFDIG
jgi:hypothetical protein